MHDDTQSLVADLKQTLDEVKTRQQKNERRYDAQREDGESGIQDHYGKGDPTEPGTFVGDPYFVVPYRPGDRGDRPLGRRPSVNPRLQSDGLRVLDVQGNEVSRLQPGTAYVLEATIRNDGDLSGPPMPVEFFVNHRSGEVHVDGNGKGVVEFERFGMETCTGFTTYAPGTELEIVGHARSLSSGETYETVGTDPNSSRGDSATTTGTTTKNTDQIVFYQTATVSEYRTFETRFNIDKGAMKLDGDDFYVNVGLTDHSEYTTSDDERSMGTVIDSIPATILDSPSRYVGPLDLEASVAEAEFLGHHQIRFPEMDEKTVKMPFTVPSSRGDRVLSEFFVRTYSLSPEDFPADFSMLDHTASRLVGRTEVNWER